MPTSLPPSVREHFGEEVADDFARWLDETFQQRAVHRDEYREVLSRLDVLEEGFSHMEKRFDMMEEHVDDRLDDMEKRFGDRLHDMEKRFEDRFEQIDQRFEQVDQRFEQVDQRFESMDEKLDRMNDRILSMTRWLIGLVALFGTLVTVLLAVAQFGG
jgi:DNA anti-recombination protein RmuC